MRISDWGSDVCSSDLEVAERVVRVPAIRFARLVRREGGTHADRHAARAKEGMEMAVLAAAQIGRASCGERACQYVKTSVVAVLLNKKREAYKSVLSNLNN